MYIKVAYLDKIDQLLDGNGLGTHEMASLTSKGLDC